MPDLSEPSCRLIARLYNVKHGIARFQNTPAVHGQPPEQWAECVRELLQLARRAVAREAGLTIPSEFAPTTEGARAALAEAAAALEEVSRRYGERLD